MLRCPLNSKQSHISRRLLSSMLAILLLGFPQAMGAISISGTVNWTSGSSPGASYPTVSWDSANNRFTSTDSMTISSGGVLNIKNANGVDGASFLLTLPDGGIFRIQTGGILNLGAVSGNGNGGNFTVNLGGTTGTIRLDGGGSTIKTNGLGSGSGGVISLNGTTWTLAGTSTVQALGGSSGSGGNIAFNNPTGAIAVPVNFNVQTNGLSDATHNLITISGTGVSNDGQISASGIANSGGGIITLKATNGTVVQTGNGDLITTGAGTGAGGTIDLRAGQGATALFISGTAGSGLIQITGGSGMNVSAGGTAPAGSGGTIKIGRSTSGTVSQDFNAALNITGATGFNEVDWGNDGGMTTGLTLSNATIVPVIGMFSTGNITATGNNSFNTVKAVSTGGGTVAVTQVNGGGNLLVSQLQNTGTTTIINNDTTNRNITLQNATQTGGTLNLQTNGSITANTNENVSGTINITGAAGAGNKAGTVTISNAADTTLGRLEAATATVASTGAGSDITLSNANITNGLTLNSAQDITATTANTFGTTVAATGRNIALTDAAASQFTANGVTATGTLALTSANNQNLSLTSVDATGATTLTSGGSGNITGNTGLILRNTATINSGTGNTTLTGDFRGALTLSGNTITLADTGSTLDVASITTGVNTTSTLSANSAGASATVSSNDLGGVGQAKLLVTADKNITFSKIPAASNFDDTLVLTSNSGGNIVLDTVPMATGIPITVGTTAYNIATATQGIWGSTNGGNVTLTNVSSPAAVSVTTNNGSVTLGTSTSGKSDALSGSLTVNAGTADVLGYGSFTGTNTITGGRIFFDATTGNFSSGGLTASSSSGWNGAADQTLYILAENGAITGSGFTTSGAGNIVLQAGTSAGGAGNYINISNLSANQNASLFATGANAGTAINVAGTSSIGGNLTATGISSGNATAATNGGINVTATSGNIKTALVWADGGGSTINLTANNGSILQDTSVFSGTSAGVAAGKTIWSTGPINLTANGSATSYIDAGVMALTASGSGGNVTAKANGATGGVSINLRGRADGTVTATNIAGGNTTGDVYLGTSIGAQANLDDTNGTVFDAMGATTVKSAGNVKLYGGFYGPITVTGKTVTGVADKGNLNFSQVTSSATTGTGISFTALQGKMTGGNLSTAAGASIFLQAGSSMPRDKLANITLTSVNSGGNIDVVVAGSSNGLSTGTSVSITGSKSGTSSAKDLNNSTPLGTVSMP